MRLDTKDIPDGEIFFVHKKGSSRTSNFVLTADQDEKPESALAVKIKNHFYTSDWWERTEKDWKPKLDKAMEQMAVVIMSGWSIAAMREDEFGYPELLYRCVYCYHETTEPKGSCICRITHRALSKPKA